MNYKIITNTILILLFVIGCSNKSKVDSFLTKYENIIIKWEQKSEKESLNDFAKQINNESIELTKESDELKTDYPVNKWEKAQVDKFRKLADRFMMLQLEKAGSLVAFPQPYDGRIRLSR